MTIEKTMTGTAASLKIVGRLDTSTAPALNDITPKMQAVMHKIATSMQILRDLNALVFIFFSFNYLFVSRSA